MKIYIGSDHKGLELKKEIINSLKGKYEIIDSKIKNNPEDDYPDFAFDVCNNVINDKDSFGIVICGNGIGVSIAANKVKGILCARVTNEEDARNAKTHNNANVIALGGVSLNTAIDIIEAYISAPVINEERHLRRVSKIIKYEQGEYNEL